MNYKKILISAILMLVIDLFYLKNIGTPIFGKLVKNIQGKDLKLNLLGAGFSYLFLIIAINYFIIIPEKSIVSAFVLGLCIYGVFDATNLAIFEKYSIKASIVDTIWGAILFSITTFITYKLLKIF
tara:strand:+ start:1694 stop:2071 length:378 start_codon:yes stop_codon:yes gene_type:complete